MPKSGSTPKSARQKKAQAQGASGAATAPVPRRPKKSASVPTAKTSVKKRVAARSASLQDSPSTPLPAESTAPLSVSPAELGSGEPLHLRLCERLRESRRRMGWTLDQVASASGVSRSMISQIERGLANPTLAVAYRLASAYGLSLGDLVEPASRTPRIDVVRADDRRARFRDDAQCRVRTLSPLDLEKDVEFYEVSIRPSGRMTSSAHFRRTREFITVERGSLQVTSGDESIRLEQGDSAHYPADQPHELHNPGKSETVAFLVVIYSAD